MCIYGRYAPRCTFMTGSIFCLLFLKLKLINFSPAIEIKKKKLRFLVISVLPS